MTVTPDVLRIARKWGIDPKLIQAVLNAEGDIVKAVACSFPNVTTRSEAIEITCRSATHAMSDYLKTECPGDFVAFWAARWAPEGATNDPKALNQFWPHNVLAGWVTP